MFMLNDLLIKNLSDKVDLNTSNIQAIIDGARYSTTEHKTNKKWHDGRDIYSKLIIIDSPVMNNVTDIGHHIENVEIKNHYSDSIKLKWDKVSNAQKYVVYRKDTNSTRSINVSENNSSIMIQGTRNYLSYRIPADIWNWAIDSSLLTLYIAVECVKTTDETSL